MVKTQYWSQSLFLTTNPVGQSNHYTILVALATTEYSIIICIGVGNFAKVQGGGAN